MGDVSDIKLIMKELTTRLEVELKDVKDKSRKELDEVKQRHTADIEQLPVSAESKDRGGRVDRRANGLCS